MSIFSKLREFFTPKVIFVWHSELSSPTKCERKRWKGKNGFDEFHVLRILSHANEPLLASQIDRQFHSWGRRANDLYHRWLVDNVGNKIVFKYRLNDKGYDLLLQLEKKYDI